MASWFRSSPPCRQGPLSVSYQSTRSLGLGLGAPRDKSGSPSSHRSKGLRAGTRGGVHQLSAFVRTLLDEPEAAGLREALPLLIAGY